MHSRFLASAVLGSIYAFFAASNARAQSPPAAPMTIAVGDYQLTPLVEVRTRAEYRHSPVDIGGGPNAQPIENAWVASERSRLGLGAERGPLRVQLTLQDARAWGATPTDGTVSGQSPNALFGAYEAFAEVHTKPVGGSEATTTSTTDVAAPLRQTYFRLGRQAVTWADGRLLGNADWSPSARTLDAARLHIATSSSFDVELLAAILDASHPLGTSFAEVNGPYSSGSQLYGAYFGFTYSPLLKMEAFGLARLQGSNPSLLSDLPASANQGSDFAIARESGETYTGALRISGDCKCLEYSAAGYLQGGRASQFTGDRDTRLAYAFAGDVGRTFDGLLLSPRARVGASLASGDNGAGNFRAFDPILPDVQTHYGLANLFGFSNLFEAHANVSIDPTPEVRVGAEYRYARLVTATGEWLNGYLFLVGRALRSNTEYDLGHELDLNVRWRPLPQLDIQAGYAGMFLGKGAMAILANPAVARGTALANGAFKTDDFTHYAHVAVTVRVP